MQDEQAELVDVNVRDWVESARADPQLYRDRQVTEIVLSAIGLAPTLKTSLVLKGGTLMALAFRSDRVTGDVDFSAIVQPDGFDELLKEELDQALPIAGVRLGYIDLVCRVQGIKRRPRPDNFEGADFPALEIKIGFAQRGTQQEALLSEGKAARTLLVEVSFRDQVYAFQQLHLIDADVAVQAFTLSELVAEKFRALLQQPIRKRNRRQDVYDIAHLVARHDFDVETRSTIHRTLVGKCASRGIHPTQDSLEDPEVQQRAAREWDTLKLELADLPPFEEQFALVAELYRSLPWP